MNIKIFIDLLKFSTENLGEAKFEVNFNEQREQY